MLQICNKLFIKILKYIPSIVTWQKTSEHPNSTPTLYGQILKRKPAC